MVSAAGCVKEIVSGAIRRSNGTKAQKKTHISE